MTMRSCLTSYQASWCNGDTEHKQANTQEEETRMKWIVTGIVDTDTGTKEKSVTVVAPDKIQAIEKGMTKLDTRRFVKCTGIFPR